MKKRSSLTGLFRDGQKVLELVLPGGLAEILELSFLIDQHGW